MIGYVTRSLTNLERRYSQSEKEALALVWACERLNVFGRRFELETPDRKPLEYICSPTSKPSGPEERWCLRLQTYNFKVVHRPGFYLHTDQPLRGQLVQRHSGDCLGKKCGATRPETGKSSRRV